MVSIIIGALTFVIAVCVLLASITSWFKQSIPIEFGFLVNDKIVQQIELSTGDPAKPISLRFCNSGKCTLIGVTLNIRFHRPLKLSATKTALTIIPDKTDHGQTPDNRYYSILYKEIAMVGEEYKDFTVELNTQSMNIGTYTIGVTAYSTQQLDYKYKKSELSIFMK